MKILFIGLFALTSLVIAANDTNDDEQTRRGSGLPPNRCSPPLIPNGNRNQRWSISTIDPRSRENLMWVAHGACGDDVDKLRLKLTLPTTRIASESKHFIFERAGIAPEEGKELPTGPWNIRSGFFTVDNYATCITNEYPTSSTTIQICNVLQPENGPEIHLFRKDQQYAIHCASCSSTLNVGCIIQPWEFSDFIPANLDDPISLPSDPHQYLTNRYGSESNVWSFTYTSSANQYFNIRAQHSSL